MFDINHPHAVLIGVNEGTRTAGGGFTNAYTSHRDPLSGNNQGNFSAQQGYSSPREADRVWLGKLNSASFAYFQPNMKAAGLQPGTAGWERVLFNLRDAYVQSPASVTGSGGLLDRLPAIMQNGATVEAIARARANSYINPRTGLGWTPTSAVMQRFSATSEVGLGPGITKGGLATNGFCMGSGSQSMG